jgi:cytochrome c biogenesis protein CcmG, thiol:disulfide interchange protein DsbE
LPSTPSSADAPRRISRPKLITLLLVCVLVPAAGLAFALSRDSSEPAPRRIAAGVGKAAPDFTLRSIDGEQVSLSDFRGKPVVLAFFASWCHPCEEELPVLQKVHRDYGDKLQVLIVNYQDHVGSDSKDFVHQLKVTYPALLEPQGDPVAAQYGVHEIPQTFFIDGEGVLRDRIYGQSSRKAIQPSIDALVEK